MFRHVNDRIIVGGNEGRFECLEQQFATIEPGYSGLPRGIIERRYDPEAPAGRPGHVLITEDHRQIAGPEPFAEGDLVLSRAGSYRSLLEAVLLPPPAVLEAEHEAPPAPPTPSGRTVASLRAELDTLRQALIQAGIWRA